MYLTSSMLVLHVAACDFDHVNVNSKVAMRGENIFPNYREFCISEVRTIEVSLYMYIWESG
jgi:hypothetical protein